MAPISVLKARKREDYPFMLDYRTRWADNDMYAHMNNSIYNFLYDSVVNTYLIDHCGFQPSKRQPQYGLAVHTHNDFFASIEYPQVAELCLRVRRMGKSSITYEIALFAQGEPAVRSVGEFVQVFVDRDTNRPNAKTGMDPTLRKGLERIYKRLPGDEDDEEEGQQRTKKESKM